MSRIQKFGADVGSLVPAILIPATAVPAGDEARISEWAATCDSISRNSVFMFEVSTDNFATWPLNGAEVSRIEMPTPGTIERTKKSAIIVDGGKYFRVRYSQGVAGAVSTEVNGDAKASSITDV
jgi:hypothetical protein